ncbi:hypothetical protein NF212_15435 [Parasalinivibrio latis]|uniref:hypothetical protein n=1 Tax=Parasalinivibrio latis TaxID=2952610 RepID=UPI0030E55D4A
MRQKLGKWLFDRESRRILNTPPIRYTPQEGLVIFSMVGKPALCMYLLAIKSFLLNFGYGRVEVMSDGSLDEADCNLLRYHIPGISFSHIGEQDTGKCPTGGTWERLKRAVDLSRESYVIQLDSDTVAYGPMVDVDRAVSQNQGFVIGNPRWQSPVSADSLYHVVKNWDSKHVQPSAELVMKDTGFFRNGETYLRGCSGFAGYPRNVANWDDVESASIQFEERLGLKWHEWGSEQFMTCCLISKMPGAAVLPWPLYQNFRFPDVRESMEASSFIHFIGSHRYERGTYRQLARRTISRLDSAKQII